MIADKIRILLIKRKMTLNELAAKVGTTPQNMSNKLRRDNFNEHEIVQFATVLGAKLDITFELDETGERI